MNDKYFLELQEKKLNGPKLVVKDIYRIPRVSKKKAAKNRAELPEKELKEAWFAASREEMTGMCQCGCGERSQKLSDQYYRNSACHIFPKRLFKSIQFHRLNRVERAFFGGCHTNMDEQSLDKWPGFADWADIRRKVIELDKHIAPAEKKLKFYNQIMDLVAKN